LFDRLCHELTQNRDALVEQHWLSTSLLDHLSLWVTEIFLKVKTGVKGVLIEIFSLKIVDYFMGRILTNIATM